MMSEELAAAGLLPAEEEIQETEIAQLSHPVLKAKPNALITCAPGSSYTHA
jgi:hypothetical protein